MKRSVSDGASEMERFSENVGAAVNHISQIGKQLAGIMERVRTLPPRFESVQKGMDDQSESAVRISETMEQLHQTTQATLEALREFNVAAEYLREAAQGLQDEVSRFRVTEVGSKRETQ